MLKEPLSEHISSGLKAHVSTDIGKGKMSVVPGESVFMDKKSAINTTIDLQVVEMEILSDEEIEAYDRWIIIQTVQPLSSLRITKVLFQGS